ncbi:hypothetical protein [Methylorubrum salsuginis]|uniref:Uncharacterized protein n=1 Tax=Methylorubrum salsuginis TaxID=414703 RepID=A0A1I4FKW8_9HYPH|nr:hypothetical protein [Methylorubrum salsuginis]SFL17577.1 hypothetical protein SAMN04488125_11054 [Methylorubrum salsuginis]
MLSAADLAGYNFEGLSEGLLALSARRGLAHRQGARLLAQKYAPLGPDDHVIGDRDFPEVEDGIAALDEESRLLAEAASAVGLVGRLLADQGSGQQTEEQGRGTRGGTLSALDLIRKALAAISGAPLTARHCRTLAAEARLGDLSDGGRG